jgi:hypothetical protein
MIAPNPDLQMTNKLLVITGTTAITTPEIKQAIDRWNAIFRLLPPDANLGAKLLATVRARITPMIRKLAGPRSPDPNKNWPGERF